MLPDTDRMIVADQADAAPLGLMITVSTLALGLAGLAAGTWVGAGRPSPSWLCDVALWSGVAGGIALLVALDAGGCRRTRP